ncbi:unnamed protein product, partial [Symbiodinium sp. CCMP2456]
SRHATPTPPSRQNPPKPAALPGVRPPSSQGSRGGMQGQGQLLLSKSGQLRRTATGGGLIGPESPNALHVPGAPGGLKTHSEESPPPTRPGTAASLASVQHAYRRDPQRYRVELPGQMPEIATPDPSPPATQPAALALRVRPGTGAHGHGQWRVLPTAKATNARPTSSGGDPALQPLSLSLTLKSGSSNRRTLTSAGGPRPETSEKAKSKAGFKGFRVWMSYSSWSHSREPGFKCPCFLNVKSSSYCWYKHLGFLRWCTGFI